MEGCSHYQPLVYLLQTPQISNSQDTTNVSWVQWEPKHNAHTPLGDSVFCKKDFFSIMRRKKLHPIPSANSGKSASWLLLCLLTGCVVLTVDALASTDLLPCRVQTLVVCLHLAGVCTLRGVVETVACWNKENHTVTGTETPHQTSILEMANENLILLFITLHWWKYNK